jgi:hypothetical protein
MCSCGPAPDLQKNRASRDWLSGTHNSLANGLTKQAISFDIPETERSKSWAKIRWHAAMEKKYRWAADHAWLPIAPDPARAEMKSFERIGWVIALFASKTPAPWVRQCNPSPGGRKSPPWGDAISLAESSGPWPATLRVGSEPQPRPHLVSVKEAMFTRHGSR